MGYLEPGVPCRRPARRPGGHLALWLAARRRIGSGVLKPDNPLPIAGVVSLGGIANLSSCYREQQDPCGAGVALLVGDTTENAERYAQASPTELLPIGVPQLLLHGVDDRNVPLAHVQAYARLARRRGDDARLVVIPDAAHFELMAPSSEAWSRIRIPLFQFLQEIRGRGE
jgi:pimeloyl-ACP methyl ester carboxylesterase